MCFSEMCSSDLRAYLLCRSARSLTTLAVLPAGLPFLSFHRASCSAVCLPTFPAHSRFSLASNLQLALASRLLSKSRVRFWCRLPLSFSCRPQLQSRGRWSASRRLPFRCALGRAACAFAPESGCCRVRKGRLHSAHRERLFHSKGWRFFLFDSKRLDQTLITFCACRLLVAFRSC